MKNILRIVCSLLFATNMSLPADALANEMDESVAEDQEFAAEAAVADQYRLSLVVGDFGLSGQLESNADPTPPALIFVSDPSGNMVKDAQVVTSLTAVDGSRKALRRAWPCKGGYLLPTHDLASGRYFVEAEIITGGRMLTDLFTFEKA